VARIVSLVATAVVLAACSPTEDQAGIYEQALRRVMEDYGATGIRIFIYGGYCQGAGGSEWPPRCHDPIPEGLQEALAERLEGTADVEFITKVEPVIHPEFGIIRGGGLLVLLGAAQIEGDRASLGINWSDEDPRIRFTGWRLDLRLTDRGWEIVDIAEKTGRITG
jgi:hypothetical protein